MVCEGCSKNYHSQCTGGKCTCEKCIKADELEIILDSSRGKNYA